MNSGIYLITVATNSKRYIGSAVSFRGRFAVHRSQLRSGKHGNRHLQRAWVRDGENSFEFRRLIICAPKDLVFYEQRAIDAFRPEYNLSPTAGSALGVKWSDEARARKSIEQRARPSFLGRRHTPETLARMSEAQRGNTYTRGKKRNPDAVAKTAAAHRGMKRSEETRAKIAAKAIGRKRDLDSVERGAEKLRGVKRPLNAYAHLFGNKHAAGHKHTDEWRAEASVLHTGRKRPKDAEYRAKISASLKGVPHSPERRAKQAAAQLGLKRGPYRKRGAA